MIRLSFDETARFSPEPALARVYSPPVRMHHRREHVCLTRGD